MRMRPKKNRDIRLSDPVKRVTLNVPQELIDAPKGALVLRLPIDVFLPRMFGEQDSTHFP